MLNSLQEKTFKEPHQGGILCVDCSRHSALSKVDALDRNNISVSKAICLVLMFDKALNVYLRSIMKCQPFHVVPDYFAWQHVRGR